MTDKVQKIREEVEMVVNRRLNLLNGDYFDLNKEANGFANEIMDIIDSLQEEPVSEDLEEAICQSFIYHENRGDDFRSDKQIETAYRYGFEAGAKWQREQDQSTIELAEDHAMLAGMEKMKEKMMAKAIDGEVGYWNLRGLSVNMDLSSTVEEGDKVKVIVIKED